MSFEQVDFKKKNIKTGALSADLAVIFVAIAALFLLVKHNFVQLPEFFCEVPVYETASEALDMGDSWGGVVENVCNFNLLAKMLGYVGISYLLICVVLICSPLKASPGMCFSKAYVLNEKGGKPQLHEALKLMLFNSLLAPLIGVYLYFYYHDFSLYLHQAFNLSFLCGGGGATLLFLSMLGKSDLVWEEKISGLRLHFTDKKKKKIDKIIEKQNRWYNRYFNNSYVAVALIGLKVLIFGTLAINVLREVGPPQDYNEIIYKRAAPVWEDNAFFALAGLDAPAGVQDSYEYGRQEVIYHSGRYARYKKEIGVPYVHEVPESSFSLYQQDSPRERLALDDRGLSGWSCLYDLKRKESSAECPDKGKVLDLINVNAEIWQRFRRLPDHSSFSIPDMGLDGVVWESELIDLVRLNVVYIFDLQAQGQSEQAMEEWLRYMDLYLKMINEPSNMVGKAVFLVVIGVQYSALEPLLHNDPELAISHGDQIQELLDITDVNFFGAGDLLANDWRGLEPMMLSPMGVVPHHRKLFYECVQENKRIASLPADEYFKTQDDELCREMYPEDPGVGMLRSLTAPGNYISNVIQYLLMGGMTKGGELVANMHRFVADLKMATVAVELIRNNVAPEGVEDYLKAMPETYWNPITKSPFSWDEEKLQLYYPNPLDPDGVSVRSFRINLASK